MNLESRVKKLESLVGVSSEFCLCKASKPGCSNVVVIEPEMSEGDRQQMLVDARRPIHCDNCGKQIERHIIIINEVESTIPVPEGGFDQRAAAV